MMNELKAPTLTTVRSLVARSNSLRATAVKVTWVQRCRLVTFPTGHVELRGLVKVVAAGYRETVAPVSVDRSGTWFGR